MTIIRPKKVSSRRGWKQIENGNFLVVERKGTDFRILLTNKNAVIQGESKNSHFILAEDDDSDAIEIEKALFQRHLLPILQMWTGMQMTVTLDSLATIVEGIEDKQQKEETRQMRETDRRDDRSQRRRRDESEGFEVDPYADQVSSRSHHDQDQSIPFRDLDEVSDRLADYSLYLKGVRKSAKRFERLEALKRDPDRLRDRDQDKRTTRQVRQSRKEIVRNVRRVNRLDDRMKDFFVEQRRLNVSVSDFQVGKGANGGAGSSQVRRFEPVHLRAFEERYRRLAQELASVRKTPTVQDAMLAAQASGPAPGSHTRRKLERRRRRRGEEEDIDEESVIERGAQRQQRQAQAAKFVLRVEDAMTVDTEHAIAVETRNDLQVIQQDMNEVMDIMHDMKHLVDEGDPLVDRLGTHVGNTRHQVDRGRKNIRAARKAQKGGLRF